MDDVSMGGSELTLAIQSVVTYMLVMGMRKIAPDFWDGLGGRFKRMISVAVSSVIVAIITGLMTGQSWGAIVGSAIAAFAGSVAIRQATKRKTDKGDISGREEAKGRPLSITTSAPDVVSGKTKSPDVGRAGGDT